MFTGLIEEIGTVRRVEPGRVTKITVASSKVSREVSPGDSVSVSGVCLTAVRVGSAELTFDAVPETLFRSTLKEIRPGDKVNLESSLRAGEMIGGHFVMGHVDGVGTVAGIREIERSAELRVNAPAEVMRYVVEKGSIAVDGVSLTVVSWDNEGFSVALIPFTLAETTLGSKKCGDRVNLEADILGKYVEKFVSGLRDVGGITEDKLRKAGF